MKNVTTAPDWLARLEARCTRAEQEFPRLAAPDGTVAVDFKDLRKALQALGSIEL